MGLPSAWTCADRLSSADEGGVVKREIRNPCSHAAVECQVRKEEGKGVYIHIYIYIYIYICVCECVCVC